MSTSQAAREIQQLPGSQLQKRCLHIEAHETKWLELRDFLTRLNTGDLSFHDLQSFTQSTLTTLTSHTASSIIYDASSEQSVAITLLWCRSGEPSRQTILAASFLQTLLLKATATVRV